MTDATLGESGRLLTDTEHDKMTAAAIEQKSSSKKKLYVWLVVIVVVLAAAVIGLAVGLSGDDSSSGGGDDGCGGDYSCVTFTLDTRLAINGQDIMSVTNADDGDTCTTLTDSISAIVTDDWSMLDI